MTAINAATLHPEQLAQMLREWANGLLPCEAAVGLLIAHDRWLRRRDFATHLVDAVDDGWGAGGRVVPMASIDWERVESFLRHPHTGASSSEVAILQIAASLAGAESKSSLMEMTRGLDSTNTAFVLDAIAHRAGWHERAMSHTVTGTIRVRRRSGPLRPVPRPPSQAPA